MGVLARELDLLGGRVRGVKARSFLEFEHAETVLEIGENEMVPDLHSQKVRMAELSDAFLFLPGGFGIFEELGTYRMWGKLGESSP
jgi:predicted Rossmann-fold nucleotide-binding protein